MAILTASLDVDECTGGDDVAGYAYDGDASVRICNDAAENGYEQEPGTLTWLNSARITTDPNDDAVHCVVSVGDPRGGFCFTVRRCPDGRIVLHLPHPGEGMPHLPTKQLHEGTLVVVDHQGQEVSFADPEEEEDEENEIWDLDDEQEVDHDAAV